MAGEFLLRNIDHAKLITSVQNPTTQEDLDSEKIILSILQAAYPDHAFLGEELGRQETSSEYTWIIDPIDGTNNYIEGRDTFSVSIGLEKSGEIILGVVYLPKRDELFVAELDKGATLNGDLIRASTVIDLEQAVITYSAYPGSEEAMKVMETKLEASLPNMKRFGFDSDERDPLFGRGSMAAEFCYVACGRIDGLVRLRQKPWDVAAGSLIVREAGAVLADLQNHVPSIYEGDYVAANPELQKKIIALLQ